MYLYDSLTKTMMTIPYQIRYNYMYGRSTRPSTRSSTRYACLCRSTYVATHTAVCYDSAYASGINPRFFFALHSTRTWTSVSSIA